MGLEQKVRAHARNGVLVGLALGAVAAGGPAVTTASAADQAPAYELVHGCFALKSAAAGAALVQAADGSWAATAKDLAAAEPLRMQATDLGHYLFFARDKDFVAGDGAAVSTIAAPGPSGDWHVVARDGAFRVSLPSAGLVLVASADGALSLVASDQASQLGSSFSFEPAKGCAQFPEMGTGVTGEPSKGKTEFAETRGLLDGHLHHMAFEFLGGSLHCGRPWHRYGVAVALPDCNADVANGVGRAVTGKVLGGDPNSDQVGWPTFNNWPKWNELTYEGTYWKWMERSWQAGMRMFTNLLVDNAALCDVYPFKRNSCNEMDTVRLELKDTFALQDYIDAQYGGPGKGFYRIVRSPNEARRVINDGKLAVVLGIEISSLFDCGIYNDQPQCDRAQIDRQLKEMYDGGVRQMELVNKFDNALSGVAGDAHETGVLVNGANKMKTGKFWDMQTCPGDGHNHDREQFSVPGYERDQLAGNVLGMFLPAGQTPLYPAGPHCNTRGLSALGGYLIRRMVEKGMLFDPDHMSVLGRDQALTVIEASDYSGVLSSHSWSDPSAIPRIYKQGGVVTPYAGSSTGFVKEWREAKKLADPRYYFGFGYGADMNGFGAQGPPREDAAKNPVTYPFKSFDGKQTVDKQVSGVQEYDINVDGVAHYGLYPDWIEDLRKIAGPEIIEDMARGPEAFLQMWERATGVPANGVRSTNSRFDRRGLGAVRLGESWESLLANAGQPLSRRGHTFTYRVAGTRNAKARVRAVFGDNGRVAFVASTSRNHAAAGVRVGSRAPRLRGATRSLGRGVRARAAGRGAQFVYGVRRGRVTWVAVAAPAAVRSAAAVRAYIRTSGLR